MSVHYISNHPVAICLFTVLVITQLQYVLIRNAYMQRRIYTNLPVLLHISMQGTAPCFG